MTTDSPNNLPSPANQLSSAASTRKRPHDAFSENRRKDPKVSRACDSCKNRKIRCTGTLPCENCTRRRLRCEYASKYARGRPPTPPPLTALPVQAQTRASERQVGLFAASPSLHANSQITDVGPHRHAAAHGRGDSVVGEEDVPSRTSPELVIEGQYVDPSSGLTFFHRAWRKVSLQSGDMTSHGSNEAERNQPLASAGDRPFHRAGQCCDAVPDDLTARRLISFYFESCVVTYRMFHQPTVEGWLETILEDRRQQRPISQSVGRAKCAIILTIMAIARFRIAKVEREIAYNEEPAALYETDPLFCAAMDLTEAEMGFPRLESAQARLVQVLYLLQTSRMNKAWYVFGSAHQIVSSLGLHRRYTRKQNIPARGHSNYIKIECAKRVFWVTYTIDKYLSVVMGRPQLLHDDDIDQDFPDSVNDEDIGPRGLIGHESAEDCHVDSLIFHAKIAHIIGRISRQVYSGSGDRMEAAHRLVHELHLWRTNLPLHLGTIKPSTLIPSFRRQATALHLAYTHALIHANRPFLLGDGVPSDGATDTKARIAECISAARSALELVNTMAKDTNLFHSFWWTHYVTFCALAVVYVWQIQREERAYQGLETDESHAELLDLAERCRTHLLEAGSAASPGRRYALILEELHSEAQRHTVRSNAIRRLPDTAEGASNQQINLLEHTTIPGATSEYFVCADQSLHAAPSMLDAWQTADWLELDSSAFLSSLHYSDLSPSW
ncbi:hypothetical protein BBP40_008465 [Aspergillus hancockii]|nr:hypothetical protein BBP40_008465 [Aspergillus hancockii]